MWRVAVVGACPYPAPQGSQVLLESTARGLQQCGHEVHLVVYGYGIGDPPPDIRVHRALTIPGVRRTRAGPSLVKPLLDAALVAALRKVVREQRIDIVHAHNYEGLIAALASGFRPIAYHAHNAMTDELPYYFPRRLRAARAFGGWLDTAFPRRADAIITPHKRLRDYLVLRRCRPERIHVVPPSVETRAFDEPRYGSDPPAIVYAGNLDAYQNLGLLTEAVRRLRRKHADVRWIVATAAEGSVKGAETVRTCTVAGLRGILSQDVIVACPTVACKGSAHPIEDERTGLIVPNNNAEAFAQALERLYESAILRKRLGKAARAAMIAKHSPEDIAAKISAVYATLFASPLPTA